MAKFTAAWRTAGAGSTTLPIGSLYTVAGCRPRLLEVGVFNSTTTALAVKLARLTSTGTQGSTITASYEDDDAQTVLSTAKDTHTVAPTIASGSLRQADIGAAIGAGVIWTFSGDGAAIPAGTANGIGICIATGTGQICDVYFVWRE